MKRALLFGLAIALCSVPALAETEVRFFAEGNLIVGAHVGVITENPYVADKLAPSPDGTYVIQADEGSKVTLYVHDGITEYNPVTVSVLAGTETMDIDVVPQQANDTCETATALAVPSVTAGTTIGAGADPGAPLCGTAITANGVWYTVVGTGNTMTASTCNDGDPSTGSADYDSKLNIYCKGCDTLQCVAGNDDGPGCAGFSSSISWCSEAGAEYQILVQGFAGSVGNFELAILDNGAACSGAVACLPPPPRGACCNCLPAPFNCTEGTLDECAALAGEYQGDDTGCLIIDDDSAPGLAIPDGAAVFVSDTITVADSGIINDVNVAMTITHTWIGDLQIDIEHGPVQTLWTFQCGSTDNINSSADDEYNSLSCAEIAAGPLFDVKWPPAIGGLGPLSIYDGLDKQGDWTISLADFVGADSGTLDYWALQFNDEVFPSICETEVETNTICHCPDGHCDAGSGVGTNCRTITIGAPAVDAHLAQHECDYLGACLDGNDDMAEEIETELFDTDESDSAFAGR